MFNIGMSFRVLANLEQAFISHLNWSHNTQFEFRRIKTSDFAFEYGMSEQDYNYELNFFLQNYLSTVKPVWGAVGAISSLRRTFPEISVITNLDGMHHDALVAWFVKNFDGWAPEVVHADSHGNKNRNQYWFEKNDICFVKRSRVFVTDNPIHAQQVASLLMIETEVLMLEQPWNISHHPIYVSEYGTWEEVLTEIYVISND